MTLSQTRQHVAPRRVARHTRAQFLVTADETSLVDLEALLATLPLCATGRVFVEVPDASWFGVVAAPPRMVVTWLDRSARTGAPGSGRSCAPGEAVSRAAVAWANEMMCDEGDSTRVQLLGGYLGTADIVDHLTENLGIDQAAITLPAWFPTHG